MALIINACSSEVLESSKHTTNSKVRSVKTSIDFEKQVRQSDFSTITLMRRDSKYTIGSGFPDKSTQAMMAILTHNYISAHFPDDAKSPKDWQTAHQIAKRLIEENKGEIYYNHLSQYLTHYVVINKKLLADPSNNANNALKYYMDIMNDNDSINAGLFYFSLKKLRGAVDDKTLETYRTNVLKRLDIYIPNFEEQCYKIQAQSDKYRAEKGLPNDPNSALNQVYNIFKEQKFYYEKLQKM